MSFSSSWIRKRSRPETRKKAPFVRFIMEYFRTTKKGYFVAYRDSIAASIENAATDSGLRVPQDVEILSLVGTKYANIMRPTITSMQLDMSEVGKRSMYMLIDLINRDLVEKSYKFDAHLVERNSTEAGK